MKKGIYLLVATIIVAACSSGPHYVVRGKIKDADSMMFYLQKREAGNTVLIDSAYAKDGSFVIKGGTVTYPQQVMLIAGNSRRRLPFYLENSDITITGRLDSLSRAKITGSKTQELYDSLILANKPLSDDYSRTYQEYQSTINANNPSRLDPIRKKLDSLETAMMNLQKSFVKSHPASYISPSLIAGLSHSQSAEETEAMIGQLDTALASLPVIKTLKERLLAMKVVAVGKKAPDFTLNDPDGKEVSLSSRIGSGLLLLDFWASWCSPCRQENPNVVKVYSEFHKKGFEIIGISLDSKKEEWLKAIADDKLSWTHVSDLREWQCAPARLYAVSAIPANFLIDASGTIIAKDLRGEDLYNKVKEVLAK